MPQISRSICWNKHFIYLSAELFEGVPFPTADVKAALQPLMEVAVLLQAHDIDGHLAPTVDRPAWATVTPDGIWSIDAEVPAGIQSAVYTSSHKYIEIALTGGGALRGRNVMSSNVGGNAHRIIYVGSDGGELLLPGEAQPRINQKYIETAAIVTRVTGDAVSRLEGLGVQIERKGNRKRRSRQRFTSEISKVPI